MRTIIVYRKSWSNCYNLTYIENGFRMSSKTLEYLTETYGIEHWEKINLDQYRIKFNDEVKMTYWLLKWS